MRPAAPGHNLRRAVRRLFTTFSHGPPGVGLLLLRLVAGIALLVDAATALRRGLPLEAGLLHAISAALGVSLLAGLWTPIAGAVVAVDALWNVFSSGHPWRWILLGTLGVALTLLGPGVWSVDARLFGWRRLEIPARKGPPPTPQ